MCADTIDGFVRGLKSRYKADMERLVRETYTDAYLDSLGGPEAVVRSEFPKQAWSEMFFGILPPSRQLQLIYEKGEPFGRDRDLVVGLGKQIQDEVKHAKLYAGFAERFGAPADIAAMTPSDEMTSQARSLVDWDEPHHIAAAFQCSVEITAAMKGLRFAEYIEPEFPSIAGAVKSDIVADEGDHQHVGRLIIRRFADPAELDHLERIAAKAKESSKRKNAANTS